MQNEPASALLPASHSPRLNPRPQYYSQIPSNISIAKTPVASYLDSSPMAKVKPDAVGVHNLQSDNMSFSTAPSTTGQTMSGTAYLKQFEKANQQAAQVLLQTHGKSEIENYIPRPSQLYKSPDIGRKQKAVWKAPSSKPFGRMQPDAYLSPSKPRAILRPKGVEENMLIVGKGQLPNLNSNMANNMQGYPNLRPVKPIIGQHLPLAVPQPAQLSGSPVAATQHPLHAVQQPLTQESSYDMYRRNSLPRAPNSIFQNTALANLELESVSGGASPTKNPLKADQSDLGFENNMFKINSLSRHRNSASVTLDPLRSSRRTLELLPAEHTDFVAVHRDKNRESSSQVQSNFDPYLYQNQQVLLEDQQADQEGMQNITSYLMKTGDQDIQNNLVKAASYIDQRRREMGKTPIAGMPTGAEGGTEKPIGRKRSSRNLFLGSVYNNILSSVQSQVQDSPIPVGDQIPLSLREEALYPKIHTVNSQLSNYESPNLASRNDTLDQRARLATLDLGPNDAQKQALSDRFSSQHPLNSRRTTIEMQAGSQQLARLQTYAVNEAQGDSSPFGSPAASVFGKQKPLDIMTGGMNMGTAVDSGDMSPNSFSSLAYKNMPPQPAPMANNWGYPSQPVSQSGFSSPHQGLSPVRSDLGVPQNGLYPTQGGLHYNYGQPQQLQMGASEQPVPMVQAPNSGRFDMQRVSPLKYGMPMSPL